MIPAIPLLIVLAIMLVYGILQYHMNEKNNAKAKAKKLCECKEECKCKDEETKDKE